MDLIHLFRHHGKVGERKNLGVVYGQQAGAICEL